MAKKIILAILAVFVAWSTLDFVIHGWLLSATYQSTAHLWRPMEEMKMGLMYVVTILSAICFTLIYACLIGGKGIGTGVKYGLLLGLGTGVSMSYGTYSYMPIPHSLALSWFLGTVVQTTLAGLLVGLIIKEESAGSGAN